ncbi:ATPase family associated with various cellular activities (AAA) [Nesidiocoris tenuis]|uniref:ATPase family associated with various cellular activities (AAA) n=1 Tax=Nesidiocoris tenuis TaxID=355587 RepID=A0ABN7B3F4_9HEMI|nr:ATPase family associated with various cellular activities (AAA) [Nesidiocoris tenuis]
MYRKGLPALRRCLRRRSLTGGGPRDDEPGGDVGRQEEEEEELIASKRSREMRRKHNAPSKQVEPSSSYDGIRRSTRQRKVIFENVSDSWIVGNRAVRGYPDYLRSPRHVRVTRRSLRAVRYTSANGLDEDDDEVEEPDDDVEVVEEEQTRSKTNGTASLHASINGLLATEAATTKTKEETPKWISGKKKRKEAFQDMYARVKRRRRAAAQQRRSPDSMSASENNSRGYSLRKTKPAVQRFQIEWLTIFHSYGTSWSENYRSIAAAGLEKKPIATIFPGLMLGTGTPVGCTNCQKFNGPYHKQ